MRQRRIKDLDSKIEAFRQYCIDSPGEYKGRWREEFAGSRPFAIEIGCGKGQFITRMSERYPDWMFLGFEGHRSVALHALEKERETGSENVRFVLQYIRSLDEIFADGEVDWIFLNFSDPWPKERHAKRRLTYGEKLKEYARVLSPGGILEFKTDNDGLFEYSLEQVLKQGCFVVEEVTRDLHVAKAPSEYVTTEYEDKFSAAGKSINFMRLKKA